MRILRAVLDLHLESFHDQITLDDVASRAGDVAGAVDNLLDHYASTRASALRLLAQEERVPQLKAIADRGRRSHYDWVEHAFAPFLEARADGDRLRAELIAITDVYVWKVLRLDLGLDWAATGTALVEMIQAVNDKGARQ